MSYALVELYEGTEVQWLGSANLGRYQRVSDAVRSRAETMLESLVSSIGAGFRLLVTYDDSPSPIQVPALAPVPADGDASTIYCVVSVRWDGTQLRGTANADGEFPYRFSGTVRFAFLAPRMYGDGFVTEAIEFLADDLRQEDAGEVHYRTPTVVQGSPGVGNSRRFARTLEVPFYVDEDNAVLQSSGTERAADFDAIAEVCRTRFETLLAIPQAITAVYDNAPTSQAISIPHASCSVLFGASELASLASGTTRYRSLGLFQVTFSVPLWMGDATALALADLFFDAFHDVQDRGVRFHAPSIRTSGRAGALWQLVIDVPFRADILQ